ncbi:MAG: TetR family transcriptional regulator [Gracilibacter sp. BRH_c7a]|nr:MAG: TetR family transcriptional regulator [Gracilibacter sp. BRH_c7a]
MPKTFSETERAYIKHRLKEEAKLCLTQFGVRKTTVDELVRRVNIPKGTFYLFYQSKELLLFEVFNDFHDEIQTQLFADIMALKGDLDARTFTELIWGLYKAVEDSFMLQFMTNGEMELLIRKLPAEIAKIHTDKDDFNVENLISLVPQMKKVDSKAFSGALRGIFLAMLHKHEIGEEVFDEALKIMIQGVVMQMFEGEKR